MDISERNLEAEYRGMIKSLAMKHIVPNARFDTDDLYSVGLYAAVKAIPNRPTDVPYQESTWVYRAIDTAMRDFVRSNRFDIHVSHHKQKQSIKEHNFDVIASEASAIRLDKETNCGDGIGSMYDIIASGEPPPLDKMISTESIEFLKDEINSLSERERNVINAYYFKDLKLKDIAEAEGCSTQRVAQIKDRAFKKIKDGMTKRYADAIL